MQACSAVLHVYCDAKVSEFCWSARGESGCNEYVHPETGNGARRMAKRDGWLLSANGEHDVCPVCQKEGATGGS